MEISYDYVVLYSSSPAIQYMVKINNRNTRTTCEAYSKWTIKTWRRHHWLCSGVFIVNFEHISHLILLSFFLTLNRLMFAGSQCYDTLSTPEQKEVIALLSLLLTLNISSHLLLFLLLTLNTDLFFGFDL